MTFFWWQLRNIFSHKRKVRPSSDKVWWEWRIGLSLSCELAHQQSLGLKCRENSCLHDDSSTGILLALKWIRLVLTKISTMPHTRTAAPIHSWIASRTFICVQSNCIFYFNKITKCFSCCYRLYRLLKAPISIRPLFVESPVPTSKKWTQKHKDHGQQTGAEKNREELFSC